MTAVCGTVHGIAVGLMLPQVVRFNSQDGNPYSTLMDDAEQLAQRIEQLLDAGRLPRRLGDIGADAAQLPHLAAIVEMSLFVQCWKPPRTSSFVEGVGGVRGSRNELS